MRRARIIVMAALLSTAAQAAPGQDRPLAIDDPAWLPTLLRSVKVELKRRLPELNENPEDVNKPFAAGDKLYFRLLMTNNSPRPITILLGNTYSQHRLELFKDGVKLSYLKEVAESAAYPLHFGRGGANYNRRLSPGEATYVNGIVLSDWYGPLSVGKYRLRYAFRFAPEAEWAEAPELTFAVVEGPVIYDEKTDRVAQLNQAQRKAFDAALTLLTANPQIPEKRLEAYDVELKEDAETFVVHFRSRSRRRFFESKTCDDFKIHAGTVGWDAYYRLRKSDYSLAGTIFGPPC